MRELLTPELIPVISAMAGAGAGVFADARIQTRIAQERSAAAESLGDIVETSPELSRAQRLGRVVIGPLALAGATTGLLNGIAWQPETESIKSEPAQIELIADFSGATAFDGGKTRQAVMRWTDALSVSEDFTARIHVARNGVMKQVQPQELKQVGAFGMPPLERGVRQSLDDIRSSKATAVQPTDSTAAIVVVTHGNAIGSPSQVAANAKKLEAPVYIVNTDPKTEPAVTKGLQAITSQSGGVYLDAKASTGKAIDALADKLKPIETEIKARNNNLAQRVGAGALSLLLIGSVAWNRKNMPTTFSMKAAK